MYSSSRPNSSVGGGGGGGGNGAVGRPTSTNNNSNHSRKYNSHFRSSSQHSTSSPSLTPSPQHHHHPEGDTSISPTHSDFTLTQPYYPYVYYYYNSPFHGVLSSRAGGNHRSEEVQNGHQHRYGSPGKKMLNGNIPTFRPVTFSQFTATRGDHQQNDSDILPPPSSAAATSSKTMTPNGVLAGAAAAAADQAAKGKRRQRKGSYSTGTVEKPPPPPPAFPSDITSPSSQLSHPTVTNHHHSTLSPLYQPSNNNHNVLAYSANSAKVSQQPPNGVHTTTAPQSLSLSLSEDSATTFDSTQPVLSPKSTSGSFRSRGGSSRQSGKASGSSCLSTLCWYTLIFFVLLIVFGVAFGAGFAVAKYLFNPACDSSSSTSIFSSSSSSHNPLLQSNSARNYAGSLPLLNSQSSQKNSSSSPSSMLTIPVADNLMKITTQSLAPSLKEDVLVETTLLPLATTTTTTTASTTSIPEVAAEGRSNSNSDSKEEADSTDTQNNGPQQQHKSADSPNQTELKPEELSTTVEPPTAQSPASANSSTAENKTTNSSTTTEAPYSFDFGTDFNLEQIDPLFSNTDSIIEELFRSTSPTTERAQNESAVATTTITPPVSTQIPASSNSEFHSTNSSSSSEANPPSSSPPPPSSSSTFATSAKPPPPTDASLVEPVPQSSTELPPKSIAPINSTLIDVHQLPFSVQPSTELTRVANRQQKQQTTTLPSNQPFIPTTTAATTTTTTTTNDSIEPSSTTLDARILADNETVISESDTVTQLSGGEVERREKSVDLDFNRKATFEKEVSSGNETETVPPESASVLLSNLTNSTERMLPPTTEAVVLQAETATTDITLAASASSSTTSAPSDSDAPAMFTSDMPSDALAGDNRANDRNTTETEPNAETLPANSTTADLLFLGTSEANFTDVSSTGDDAAAPVADTANSTITTETLFPGNRTGNERALTDGNWTASTSAANNLDMNAHPNSSSSSEVTTNSTNGRLISPSLKTPEGSGAGGSSGPDSTNSVIVQELCLESQFTCPRLPIVSTIAPKAKRSVAEETAAVAKSLQPTTTNCLPQSFLCNGVVDCPADAFDEMNCGEIKCGLNFMCGEPPQTSLYSSTANFSSSTSDLMASGSSVVNVVAASGGNETVLLTTLLSPNATFSSTTLAPSSFSQAPTMCIPRQLYCDGVYDCKDGSDEIECKITKCQANEIRCVDGSACITAKMACDGVYHCKDHSDEKGCVSKSSCESAGRFFCDNGLCIDKVLHCDGKRLDCSDGSDEQNCPTLESCTSLGKFYCHTSHECIDAAMQCDGVHHCLDHSDEDFCFENDLDGVVHVFNSVSKLWSLLCVPERDFFTTLEADDLCARLGQERATNYTLIEVSRLLGGSTWATVNASARSGPSGPQYVGALAQYSQNITHGTSCQSNLTVAVQCSPYSCSAGSTLQVGKQQPQQQQQILLLSANDTTASGNASSSPPPPPMAIEVPEEVVPTPLYISARNSSAGDQAKCMAYAVSSNWLLTSGLCLNNLFHSTLLKDVHVTNGNGSLSVPVEQLRLHPQYSIFRTIRFPDYDMALVQTSLLLDGWTLGHSSICLPATKLDAEITCFIGGSEFGQSSGGNDVAFEVKEMSYCNASQHYNGIMTERTFCAERSNGKEEPSACLPPYLPLLCLTSKSQWYLSGFISYQRGCHELTSLTNPEKLPNFRGYFKHPTVFSNFFIMKDFIEHTLGFGTYMKSRPKLEPSTSSSSDNNSFTPTLMPPVESVGGQHSPLDSNANHRAAYVRKDEETASELPPLVTPDARLQKSLNLSSPDMKSENITESISKMIELSPGSAVEAPAAAATAAAAANVSVPLGNRTTTPTIPTTTITSNISDITIPITTTIAPSFTEEIPTTTTGTIINSAKENNSSSSSIELDEKPVEVESSHFTNETKSETSETLIEPNDMVIEGSGFAPPEPETEPVAKDAQQQPALATPADELTTQSDSLLTGSSSAQIEETVPTTTTVLPFSNADEVAITATANASSFRFEMAATSSPPELNETLTDQFTTLPTLAEEIETTESVFIFKGNATNSNHSSPTVTTFMP